MSWLFKPLVNSLGGVFKKNFKSLGSVFKPNIYKLGTQILEEIGQQFIENLGQGRNIYGKQLNISNNPMNNNQMSLTDMVQGAKDLVSYGPGLVLNATKKVLNDNIGDIQNQLKRQGMKAIGEIQSGLQKKLKSQTFQ